MMNEDLEISDHADLTNRLFVTLPFATAALVKGVVVRVSDQYGFSETEGGIILPGKEVHEKKYCLGEVLSIGDAVNQAEVDVGDIVTYQRTAAFRLPDGIGEPKLFRVQADGIGIVACQPNLIPEKRSDRWHKAINNFTLAQRIPLRILEVLYARRAWRLPNFDALALSTAENYKAATAATAATEGTEADPGVFVRLLQVNEEALTAAVEKAIDEYQLAAIATKQAAIDELIKVREEVKVKLNS